MRLPESKKPSFFSGPRPTTTPLTMRPGLRVCVVRVAVESLPAEPRGWPQRHGDGRAGLSPAPLHCGEGDATNRPWAGLGPRTSWDGLCVGACGRPGGREIGGDGGDGVGGGGVAGLLKDD